MNKFQKRIIGWACALWLAGVAPGAAYDLEENDVPVTNRFGHGMLTEIYRFNDTNQYPVIFQRTQYARQDPDDAGVYTAQGFIYVSQNVSGSELSASGSPGTNFYDFGSFESETNFVAETYDAIEWIVQQPWCNGRVGMVGGSGNGIGASMGLWCGHTNLVAVDIQHSAANFQHYWYFRNGVKRQMFTYSDHRGMDDADFEWPRPDTHEFSKQRWMDFIGERAVSNKVAYFESSGLYDIFNEAAFDNFSVLASNGVAHVRMPANGHAGAVAYLEADATNKYPYASEPAYNADFTAYMLGNVSEGQDASVLKYYLMGDPRDENSPGNSWKTTDHWPVEHTPRKYYFKENGDLSGSAPLAGTQSLSYVYNPTNPVFIPGGNVLVPLAGNYAVGAGPYDQRVLSNRVDVLRFVSEPLPHSVEVVGNIDATLYISTDVPDTMFVATLVDYCPDGYQALISESAVMARYWSGEETPSPLTSGTVYRLDMDMWSTAAIIDQGHRIGVHITSSSAASAGGTEKWNRYEIHPNTYDPVNSYAEAQIANQTLHLSADHPSHITLPVVPGAPLNILYIGGSDMDPIRAIVDDLAVGGGFEMPNRFTHYGADSYLHQHVEGRMSDLLPIRYWIDGGTTNWGDNPSGMYDGVIHYGLDTYGDALPAGEAWDILFVQGLSTEANDTLSSGDSARFRSNAVLLADRLFAHSPDAKIVLQETWARAYGSDLYDPVDPQKWVSPQAMYIETVANYDLAKADIEAAHPGANVVLTDLGDAWAAMDWDRSLYKTDLSLHSTTGQVLAALVAYSKFYDDYTSDMPYTTNASGVVDSPISSGLTIPEAVWTNLVHIADATARGLALEITPSAISVPEGGTNTFGVRLTAAPSSAKTVTVTRVSGDTNLTVTGGATWVFDAGTWQTYHPVTLAAAQDDDWVDSNALFRCSSPGMADLYITATEDDDETDPDYALPWSEPFEALTQGTLDGQHGWVAGAGAIVTNTDAQAGSQALSITEATASHSFDGAPTNIWIEFWSKPVRSDEPATIASNISAVFYVNTNDQLVAYDSTNATVIPSPTVSNDWNKFEIQCDYSSKVWNLELNDTLVVSNFVFHGSPSTFTAIKIAEASTNFSWIDSIEITGSQSDSDDDGLPDVWENIYYGNLSPQPDDLSSNGVNTVIEAYIAGLDPTDPNAAFLISSVFSPLSSVLSWNSFSGRVYTVYWTSNLLAGFGSALTNNLPWTGSVFTDSTHAAEQEGFYKIEVELSE